MLRSNDLLTASPPHRLTASPPHRLTTSPPHHLTAVRLGQVRAAFLLGVVSFHGILDAHPAPRGVTSLRARVLLCHADADPFVPPPALSACLGQLSELGARYQLLAFGGGTLHGFTNPAQALNERKEFDYDEHAARASWAAAKLFLEDALR